jgi:ribosomal protein L37AE/L43A
MLTKNDKKTDRPLFAECLVCGKREDTRKMKKLFNVWVCNDCRGTTVGKIERIITVV